MDMGDRGSLANHDASWVLAASLGFPWSVVIEDDALPIPGLKDHLSEALLHLPTPGIISLYTGTGKPHPRAIEKSSSQASRLGYSWLHSSKLLWGPAVALPTKFVPNMLASVSRSSAPYDTRLSHWARRERLRVYYTAPSLVDHRDERSTIATDPQPERRAINFGTPTHWNSKAVFLGR